MVTVLPLGRGGWSNRSFAEEGREPLGALHEEREKEETAERNKNMFPKGPVSQVGKRDGVRMSGGGFPVHNSAIIGSNGRV